LLLLEQWRSILLGGERLENKVASTCSAGGLVALVSAAALRVRGIWFRFPVMINHHHHHHHHVS
jgi:hypothetical protein